MGKESDDPGGVLKRLGSNYRPWLTIRDVPSRGFLARVRGWKSGREHHLVSKLELRYFFALDLSPAVGEICEQFPLLPVRETREIAKRLGVRHPTNPRTGRATVMTTDFVFANEDRTEVCARALKNESALNCTRTLQKLEIERRYWRRRKIDWALVTERELPLALARNLEWLHPCASLRDLADASPDVIAEVEEIVKKRLRKQNHSIANIAHQCDLRLGLAPGLSLRVVRHLIATGRLKIDWFKSVDPTEPLQLCANPGRGGENDSRSEHADRMDDRKRTGH
jgi:hypothetical protein